MGVYVREVLLGQYYYDSLFPRIPVLVMKQIASLLEERGLATQPCGVAASASRLGSDGDGGARRPPSVKAALSVAFGQRAPHRAATRGSSPVRRGMDQRGKDGDADRNGRGGGRGGGRDGPPDYERNGRSSREQEAPASPFFDRAGAPAKAYNDRGSERERGSRENSVRDTFREGERGASRGMDVDAGREKARGQGRGSRDRYDEDLRSGRGRGDRHDDRDREMGKDGERYRERDRDRDRDRDREGVRDVYRDRGRDRYREKDRDGDKEGYTESGRDRDRDSQRRGRDDRKRDDDDNRSRGRRAVSRERSWDRASEEDRDKRPKEEPQRTSRSPLAAERLQRLKEMYGDTDGSGNKESDRASRRGGQRDSSDGDVIRLGGSGW
eukprot:TRINITY_DN19900_c2_g2_i1.p1 TRINITY_DN19900_c2_g2~~TRINITY_DN19900_c2_g2_i1.p1  ORF type:complete len:383 (+),score=59.66 TRINITY_DN19900_c2_g2_i1:264-1412(+)